MSNSLSGERISGCGLDLFAQQAFDARLELAVLGGIDERVDAAVCEYHHDHEVIEKA